MGLKEYEIYQNQSGPTPYPTITPTPTQTGNPTPTPTSTSTYPLWDANTAYFAGEIVQWNGQVWTAKWWSQGEEPGTGNSWELYN